MKTSKHISLGIILTAVISLLASCNLLVEDQTPTKIKMQGVWKVVDARNEKDSSILNNISFPVAAFDLGSDNSVISTAGPMFMYIVYGGSNYTKIASKIDKAFNYATLNVNDGGEWFIDGGVVNHFTIEMKLQGLPGQTTLVTLLEMMGIGNGYLNTVVYHKFTDVYVDFIDNETMEWRFTYDTQGVYNMKDSKGNYVSWNGYPTTSFSKCSFILKKQTTSLMDLVKNTPTK